MAKKNYHPRQSLRKLREEKKLAERRAFYQKNKKKIWIAIASAAAAVILLILLIDVLYVPAGALRTVMGKVQGVEANSIVREMNGNYYEMAKMDPPEGFHQADFGVAMTQNEQDQNLYFVNDDASSPVNNVYVSGVTKRTGVEMLEMLQTTYTYDVQTESKATEIAGHKVNYMYLQCPTDSNNPVEYFSALIMYVDTIRDSSIMLRCSSAYLPLEELPTEEEMLSQTEGIFSMLKLP